MRHDLESKLDPVISILLVEDEKDTRDLLATILTMKYPAVTLHVASNGRIGLELFRNHLPHIVITDINMPEMCGVQMVEKIRASKPDTKFIVLTGKSITTSQQDSFEQELEIEYKIAKPVVFQELFTAIEKCLKFAQ